MLLMAGLMLADKTAGAHDQVEDAGTQARGARDRARGPARPPAPRGRTVEVPVIPQEVLDTLAELAARAEAVAAAVEEKAA